MKLLIFAIYEISGQRLAGAESQLPPTPASYTVRVRATSTAGALKTISRRVAWVPGTVTVREIPTDQLLRELGAPMLPGLEVGR